MKTDEAHIENLENGAFKNVQTIDSQYLIRALCEIARQLSRIADAYEEVHK